MCQTGNWTFLFCLIFVECLAVIVSPGTVTLSSSSDAEENEDEDSVDLEKSNVLLMGPTGSGMFDKYCFMHDSDCNSRPLSSIF